MSYNCVTIVSYNCAAAEMKSASWVDENAATVVTGVRVILISMKFGISTSTWFQVVPFCSPISEQFLFLLYDHSFHCP